ncbi:MAG TPA: diguanylate cyclase [Nitrospirales bacterium]|jgi:diguanylate cyclase (GGDEF)-like protein
MPAFRILIVDDEPAVLDVLSSTLRSQLIGSQVDKASTAETALQLIGQTEYDTIISDIHLPDMDGLTLLKNVRALCAETPTILITGLDDQELAIQALRLGAYDYIRKPLEMDYLLASVNRAIKMRQLSLKVDGQKLALEQHATQLEQTVQERTGDLSREVAERKEVAEALRQSNLKLTDWVTELEHRTRQITSLSEMTALLQACQSVEEAFTVATQFLKELFADDSGSLCLLNDSMQLLETVGSWGPHIATDSEFQPGACWALRRLQPHMMGDLSSTLICQHLRPSQAPNFFCVPLIGQGKALGLLVLQVGLKEHSPEPGIRRNLMLAKQRLGEAVANHIALALANLSLRERLRSESIRDPLTDLFNRRYLDEALSRELRRAGRDQLPLSIIVIDVDHFKQFNDKFGHEAGDKMLQALARHLNSRTRGHDIACRYGGDEFLLALPGASLEVAGLRAERIREETKNLVFQADIPSLATIRLSLGVSSFPEHGTIAAELIRAADLALYRAKAQGRDQVVRQESPNAVPSLSEPPAS